MSSSMCGHSKKGWPTQRKAMRKRGPALKRRLEVLKGLAGIVDPSAPAEMASPPASSSEESGCEDSSSSSDSD